MPAQFSSTIQMPSDLPRPIPTRACIDSFIEAAIEKQKVEAAALVDLVRPVVMMPRDDIRIVSNGISAFCKLPKAFPLPTHTSDTMQDEEDDEEIIAVVDITAPPCAMREVFYEEEDPLCLLSDEL